MGIVKSSTEQEHDALTGLSYKGKPWSIVHAPSIAVDVESRRATVPPADGDAKQAALKLLAYAVARWTKNQGDLQMGPIKTFEIGRVVSKLHQAGLYEELEALQVSPTPPEFPSGFSDVSILRYLEALWYLDAASLYRDVDILQSHFLTSLDGAYIGDWMDDVRAGKLSVKKAAQMFDARFKGMLKDSFKPGRGGRGMAGIGNADAVKWGSMTIYPTELSRPKSQTQTVIKWRAMEEGIRPKYIHRWLTDRLIFAETRKKKKGGGTILIDMSGSMDLAPEAILEAVETLPGVVIAGYAGGLSDDDEAESVWNARGSLAILAANGRMVSEIPDLGAGNIVDGPALRWLVAKPNRPPYIWVSDGDVSGEYDSGSPELTAEAQDIVNENGVIQVESLPEATRVMTKRR